MRRVIFCLAALAAVVTGCGNANKGAYLIDGRVTLPEYEGKVVYLYDGLDESVVYDSAVVVDGRFRFEGSQAEPVVRKLKVREDRDDIFPVILPFVLENAEIETDLGEYVYAGNTGLNEKMMEFLYALEGFHANPERFETADEIQKAFAEFLLGQIDKNSGTIIGQYILDAYRDKLTIAQQETAAELLK